MAALAEWVLLASKRRHKDLIYYNYCFETDASNDLVDTQVISEFSDFLEAQRAKRKTGTHSEFLHQFLFGKPSMRLTGPIVEFPRDGIVSLFSAYKLGRFFGFDKQLTSAVPEFVDPKAFDAVAENVSHQVNVYFWKSVAALKKRATPSNPTIRAASRSRAESSRTSGYKPVVNDVIWCTNRDAAAAIYSRASHSTDIALAMRRLLGLPTAFRQKVGALHRVDILSNVFLRLHFWQDVPASSAPLRKPTVFSGGFDDVYATFWGKPRSDGWGRTITLCADDASDGTIGLPEVVVSLNDLVLICAKEIGTIAREKVPGPKDRQVDVGLFARMRHHNELAMAL